MSITTTQDERRLQNWIDSLKDSQLVANYDLFNSEREKTSRNCGGRLLSGDDMKKVEALTEKINAIREEILSRMDEASR